MTRSPMNPKPSQARARAVLSALLLTVALAAVTGCARRQVAAYTPPPPSNGAPTYNNYPSRYSSQTVYPRSLAPFRHYVETHRPIESQVGVASWYGTVYNHHWAADGTRYNQDDFSAAHRTLPLGSIVKVTNLATGQSAIMSITDRGPFVPGRIIDISEASAKAIGLYREGIGEVRVSVYYSPKPLDYGGRWAVQIGVFHSKHAALKLEHHLQNKYRSASVIEFRGPTGDWVRIRPYDGNREIAMEIVHSVRPKQGAAFLVRLD